MCQNGIFYEKTDKNALRKVNNSILYAFFCLDFFLIKKYSIYDPNCNNFCHKLLNRAIVCNRLSLSYDLNS